MTLVEYGLYMKAYSLRKIDEKREFIEQEFIKRMTDAVETKNDKSYYTYTKVEDIFDYKKEEQKILGLSVEEDKKYQRLRSIAHRVKELERR